MTPSLFTADVLAEIMRQDARDDVLDTVAVAAATLERHGFDFGELYKFGEGRAAAMAAVPGLTKLDVALAGVMCGFQLALLCKERQ